MPGLDLWPANLADLIRVEPKDSPKSILQQQAQFLGEKFGGRLKGSVDTIPFKEPAGTSNAVAQFKPDFIFTPDFIHIFKVIVPDLDDYEFDLLEIRGRATPLYPVRGVFGTEYSLDLKDKKDLTAWLKKCFASPRAQEVLKSLLSNAGH
jgi:hypothetical protein